MLGKLMKHEFKNSWKILLPINIGALLAGLVVGVFLYNMPILEKLPEPLIVLLTFGFIGYCFLLAAAAILSLVFIVVRYYKSLYSAEGYLTFTLPATTTEILSAKMLTGFIWEVINSICIMGSIFLAAGGSALLAYKHYTMDLTIFLQDFTDVLDEVFSLNSIGAALFYLAVMLVNIALRLLTIFMAISLGQLWQEHKILGSVVFYFVINTVMGIISVFANIGTGTFRMLFSTSYFTSSGDFFFHTMTVGLIYSIIFCAAFYFASIYITDHKLNLD
ncbi:MAG: hypothetical protein K6A05_08470 [Lachnospiraceae bacterium]|nr:hypothetical protein [Lachnospiraceae bacterium]